MVSNVARILIVVVLVLLSLRLLTLCPDLDLDLVRAFARPTPPYGSLDLSGLAVDVCAPGCVELAYGRYRRD